MLPHDAEDAETGAASNSRRRPGTDDQLLGIVCGRLGQHRYVSRALAAFLVHGSARESSSGIEGN